MKNLEATKLARKALRAAGVVGTIHTNKYAYSRTIKAYFGSDPSGQYRLLALLAEAFGDDMPEVCFKYGMSMYGRRSSHATIIRLPFSDYGA